MLNPSLSLNLASNSSWHHSLHVCCSCHCWFMMRMPTNCFYPSDPYRRVLQHKPSQPACLPAVSHNSTHHLDTPTSNTTSMPICILMCSTAGRMWLCADADLLSSSTNQVLGAHLFDAPVLQVADVDLSWVFPHANGRYKACVHVFPSDLSSMVSAIKCSPGGASHKKLYLNDKVGAGV